MVIKKISLENFRNYKNFSLELAPQINVFHGLNGQGKTNLLEAIYLCTCARSHRTSKDLDLINFGENYYKVELEFAEKNSYKEKLSLSYQSKEKNKRIISHDDIEIKKISELMGIFHAVIFAPEDLQLLKDGPAVRRRFLDLLISQIDKLYFINLQQAAKIIQHRNKMLKEKEINAKWQSLMDVWDIQLAQCTAYILKKRNKVIDEISATAQNFYQEISLKQEKIKIEYNSNFKDKIDLEENELVEVILQKLQKNRNQDLYYGSTSIGAHKDDLIFLLNDKLAKTVASQGQTRTIILALKLAELEYITKITKIRPVLLLDDVMSELDQNRRHALIDAMNLAQVFVTCTEPEQVDEFYKKNDKVYEIQYFHIEKGQLLI